MKIEDLGHRLRNRRTAVGRTIASVAVEAGLSVPYIANLENGRGNPTLSAVSSLAAALGVRLSVELAEGDQPLSSGPLPDSLLAFSRSPRFATEAERMAKAGAVSETMMRERLLHAMAGMGALAVRPLADHDWHRILDAAVLTARA